ncbi:substrate-binding domain-containing protein [Floridanema evergladense]|uniref:Phosphate-binding protein n=1 Tax=Floridaenema evergladense BLCC-F167 TaxID=3153639 RepID=A0ABV4WNM5_9CYAN
MAYVATIFNRYQTLFNQTQMKIKAIDNWQKKLTATLTITTISLTSNAVWAQLRGGGDSFAEPLYQRYSKEYEQQTGEKFNYSIIGSGGGIRLFVNKSIDFGGSSLIPTPIEKNQMEDGLLMVPTGGGALAIVYNLPGVKREVRLSRDQLVKVFTGKITNWQQINSSLPNQKIQVVVCSGNCATSFILTKYLNKITGGKVLASRNPDWGFNVFSAFPTDSGIAGEISRIDGTIGYVQSNFALANNLSIASIENQKGRYVQPTLAETKKALANVKFNDDFTTEDIKDPEDGYPLVSLTWLLVYRRYLNPDMLKAIQNLLNWILIKGQAFNEQLEYTKVPEDVAKKAIEAVNNELKIRPY